MKLRSSNIACALVMKGRPESLSLGQHVHQGSSFEWRAGQKPVLTSLGGRSYELYVENFVPAFPVAGAASSLSGGRPHLAVAQEQESGGRSQPRLTPCMD